MMLPTGPACLSRPESLPPHPGKGQVPGIRFVNHSLPFAPIPITAYQTKHAQAETPNLPCCVSVWTLVPSVPNKKRLEKREFLSCQKPPSNYSVNYVAVISQGEGGGVPAGKTSLHLPYLHIWHIYLCLPPFSSFSAPGEHKLASTRSCDRPRAPGPT